MQFMYVACTNGHPGHCAACCRFQLRRHLCAIYDGPVCICTVFAMQRQRQRSGSTSMPSRNGPQSNSSCSVRLPPWAMTASAPVVNMSMSMKHAYIPPAIHTAYMLNAVMLIGIVHQSRMRWTCLGPLYPPSASRAQTGRLDDSAEHRDLGRVASQINPGRIS